MIIPAKKLMVKTRENPVVADFIKKLKAYDKTVPAVPYNMRSRIVAPIYLKMKH